jgi:uncharacterized protein (DUF362 family)
MLIGIFKYLGPALTIIDAITVMDGPGPIHGRARELGWLIGGTEPIACEIICSKLVNINSNDLPIINTAKHMGYGVHEADKITVVGDDFSQHLCTDFEMPEKIPLRFSFLRICKSICKQILLLAKPKRQQNDL